MLVYILKKKMLMHLYILYIIPSLHFLMHVCMYIDHERTYKFYTGLRDFKSIIKILKLKKVFYICCDYLNIIYRAPVWVIDGAYPLVYGSDIRVCM